MLVAPMRKALALKLIKLALLIYRPQVTQDPRIGVLLIEPDTARADREYAWRESRGWN